MGRPDRTGADHERVVLIRARCLLARAADRETIDAQRGLSDTHRHALAILAAGADAIIELKVIAHHADARQYIRAIADQRRAADRRTDLAALATWRKCCDA